MPSAGSFLVGENRIRVFPKDRDAVRPYLLGRVMGLWLESRGLPVLHGACLNLGEGAVGILGRSGMGKSTLSLAVLRAGGTLLSDDLIPLENESGHWRISPGIRQVRIWPDSATHFFDNFETLERVHPDHPKRKLAPDRDAGLRFAAEPARLKTVVVLSRTDAKVEAGFQWRRLVAADAMLQLIGQSYNVEILEALGWQQKRLGVLAQVAEKVPIWELTYQTGYDQLPGIVGALFERWGGKCR